MYNFKINHTFYIGFSKLKIPNQELNTSNGITICFWAKDLNNGIKYPLNIIKDGDDTKYLEIALVIQHKRLQLKMGNSWLASDEIKFPIDDDTYSENFGDNSKKNDWYFFAFKLNDNNTCQAFIGNQTNSELEMINGNKSIDSSEMPIFNESGNQSYKIEFGGKNMFRSFRGCKLHNFMLGIH